ncbi:MAG: MalY/PatB family protein [Arachnia sp.]
MVTFTDLDAITITQLQATGATRWTGAPHEIGAFTAEMDFGIDQAITDVLAREIRVGNFAYLPPSYAQALQHATAEMLRNRYQVEVPEGWIHEVPDVLRAMEMVIGHYTPPGTAVVVPTPAYMPFVTWPERFGRQVIQVPMLVSESGEYSYDLEGIDRAFASGARLLLHCDPHNPSGRSFTRQELVALSEVVERHDARVFSDEIWAPLTFSGHRHIPYFSVTQAAARHTITALSASKGWNLPGLKCAQLLVHNEADEQTWVQVGHPARHGTANLGVVANAAAYSRGFTWLDGILAYLERNARDIAAFVDQRLPRARMPRPQGTYVAWLDLSEYALGDHPAAWLRRETGVWLTEGTDCGAVGAGHVRMIHAMPHPILLEALERIATGLGEG